MRDGRRGNRNKEKRRGKGGRYSKKENTFLKWASAMKKIDLFPILSVRMGGKWPKLAENYPQIVESSRGWPSGMTSPKVPPHPLS